jgi:hypothetical protein
MRRLTWAVGTGIFAVYDSNETNPKAIVIFTTFNEVRDFIESYNEEQFK